MDPASTIPATVRPMPALRSLKMEPNCGWFNPKQARKTGLVEVLLFTKQK
jgi:hypothetical protein